MATGNATLNTDSLVVTGASVTLTTETLVTLYVKGNTGTHANHKVMLEVSPDNGNTWVGTRATVEGEGCVSLTVVCTRVRAKITRAEGVTSTVKVWVLAR